MRIVVLSTLTAILATVLLSCDHSHPRLTRTAVQTQLNSLCYFEDRIAGFPFRFEFYDSVIAFGKLDTQRTKYYVESATSLRPRDSSRTASVSLYRNKKTILTHDLNVLLLTADITK